MKTPRAIAVVLLLTISSLARAGELRCGERLVNIGDTTGEVAVKCGAPTFADRRPETDAGAQTATVDTWTYNLGPHDFIRTLTFVDGSLARIETGDYGQ